jgi:hypothetical protein
MNTRLLYSLLLAFVLLFAQQGAALHALEHFAENRAPQQEKHLPHSPVCEKCVVYAGIGGAASSSPLAFEEQKAVGILVAIVLFSVIAFPLQAYHSRAPPRSA